MKNKLTLVSILSFLMLITCDKQEEETFESAKEFVFPYAEMFYEELKDRAIDPLYTLEELNLVFYNDVGDGNVGVAKDELIAFNKQLWPHLPEDYKKFVVFHELGHSILGRRHLNDKLPNKEVKSLMRGNKLPEDKGFDVRFKGFREAYYINELFEGTTSSPTWSEESFEKIQIVDTISHYETQDLVNADFKINASTNFQIECLVNYEATQSNSIGFIWDGVDHTKRAFIIENGILKIVRFSILGYDFYDFTYRSPSVINGLNKLSLQKIDNQLFYFINDQFLFYQEFDGYSSGELIFKKSNNPNEKLTITIF